MTRGISGHYGEENTSGSACILRLVEIGSDVRTNAWSKNVKVSQECRN